MVFSGLKFSGRGPDLCYLPHALGHITLDSPKYVRIGKYDRMGMAGMRRIRESCEVVSVRTPWITQASGPGSIDENRGSGRAPRFHGTGYRNARSFFSIENSMTRPLPPGAPGPLLVDPKTIHGHRDIRSSESRCQGYAPPMLFRACQRKESGLLFSGPKGSIHPGGRTSQRSFQLPYPLLDDMKNRFALLHSSLSSVPGPTESAWKRRCAGCGRGCKPHFF